MNIQIKILLYNLKKSWLWIVIFILLVILSIIFYEVRPISLELQRNDFINLISYPERNDLNFISLLITIYQIGFIIYYMYIYYCYEIEHSFENIIIRINEKKWIFQKIVSSIIFIIFVRIIYTVVVYMYFQKVLSFELGFIFIPILYYILISMILLTIINFISIDNGIKFLLSFIISCLFFIKFNVYIVLLLIIILINFNLKFFNFKKYYNRIKRKN